jgi:hypothetical protein
MSSSTSAAATFASTFYIWKKIRKKTQDKNDSYLFFIVLDHDILETNVVLWRGQASLEEKKKVRKKTQDVTIDETYQLIAQKRVVFAWNDVSVGSSAGLRKKKKVSHRKTCTLHRLTGSKGEKNT